MTETMILINPGTGTLENANENDAIINMHQFIKDCNVDGLQCIRTPKKDDNEGRFGFTLSKNNINHIIKMPGLPLDEVRYINENDCALEYPRLYVDGSSWWWKFAILDETDF